VIVGGDAAGAEVTNGPFPMGPLNPAIGPSAGRLGAEMGLAKDSVSGNALAERLEALDEASRAVAAELDIDRVLTVIVERVAELVGARYAALGIADGLGRIERFITTGITPEERAAIGPVPVGHGLLGVLIMEGRSIRADDIARHPASVGFPPNHPPMTTFLGVPVAVKGEVVGQLYLTDKAHGVPFTDDDERLVEMFAVHAGIAIENARLHDLVQRLAIVEERDRIARDLHDGIIQAIYAVGLSLEMVPELVDEPDGRADALARVDRAIDALNHVIADIRSYIRQLRPAGDSEDPVEALARLGEELGMHNVVDLDVDIEDGAPLLRDLPPDRRSDLLFIAREALSNVARHAAASRVMVVLHRVGDDLELRIEDNGRGFDPERARYAGADGSHQGLGNMRDRAVAMGGRLAIAADEAAGTRIIVTVPVQVSAAQ
jgi:signal transduction histidine kinase